MVTSRKFFGADVRDQDRTAHCLRVESAAALLSVLRVIGEQSFQNFVGNLSHHSSYCLHSASNLRKEFQLRAVWSRCFSVFFASGEHNARLTHPCEIEVGFLQGWIKVTPSIFVRQGKNHIAPRKGVRRKEDNFVTPPVIEPRVEPTDVEGPQCRRPGFNDLITEGQAVGVCHARVATEALRVAVGCSLIRIEKLSRFRKQLEEQRMRSSRLVKQRAKIGRDGRSRVHLPLVIETT